MILLTCLPNQQNKSQSTIIKQISKDMNQSESAAFVAQISVGYFRRALMLPQPAHTRCGVCGRFLGTAPPPWHPLPGGADPALCRLCSALRQLALVARQVDPQTWLYEHVCGILETLALLVASCGDQLRGQVDSGSSADYEDGSPAEP